MNGADRMRSFTAMMPDGQSMFASAALEDDDYTRNVFVNIVVNAIRLNENPPPELTLFEVVDGTSMRFAKIICGPNKELRFEAAS